MLSPKEIAKKHHVHYQDLEESSSAMHNLFKYSAMFYNEPGFDLWNDPNVIEELTLLAEWIVEQYPAAIADWREKNA